MTESVNGDIRDVASYYDAAVWTYRLFAYNRQSLAIHYGFWEEGTRTRHEAMINQHKAVIGKGCIKPGMRVLDAGCGVGGTVFYIARQTGADVTGISISPKQIEYARKMQEKFGLGPRASFLVADFTRNPFPDGSFDVVYGIESISHAYPKSDFLDEAYRLLKPGGRLVIIDGYRKRDPETPEEEEMLRNFLYGFAVKEMATLEDMTRQVKEAGFVDIQLESRLKQALPSIRYFYFVGLFIRAATAFLRWIHPVIRAAYRTSLGAIYAYKGVRTGGADYCIYVAKKPRTIKRNNL